MYPDIFSKGSFDTRIITFFAWVQNVRELIHPPINGHIDRRMNKFPDIFSMGTFIDTRIIKKGSIFFVWSLLLILGPLNKFPDIFSMGTVGTRIIK